MCDHCFSARLHPKVIKLYNTAMYLSWCKVCCLEVMQRFHENITVGTIVHLHCHFLKICRNIPLKELGHTKCGLRVSPFCFPQWISAADVMKIVLHQQFFELIFPEKIIWLTETNNHYCSVGKFPCLSF